MPASGEPAAGGNIGNYHLRRAARREVTVVIREPNHRSRICHVDIFRSGSWRIEGDPERLAEPFREHTHGFGFAIGPHASQYFDSSRLAFRQEQVAIGSPPDEPWVFETG